MEKVHYEHYLPVVLAALTIIILGMLNPKFMRVTKDEMTKQPVPASYKWLAFFALIVGMLTVWCYNQDKHY